jgi:hypothetical protein
MELNWKFIAHIFDNYGAVYINLHHKSIVYMKIYLPVREMSDDWGITKNEAKGELIKFLKYGRICNPGGIRIDKQRNLKDFIMNIRPHIIKKANQVQYIMDNFSFDYHNSNGHFNLEEFQSIKQQEKINSSGGNK